MKKRAYIETTIPSFYFEIRTQPEMVARRNWTVEWWDQERVRYEVVTSSAVLDELHRGQHPRQKEAIELLAQTPTVPVEPAIIEIVDAYITDQVMPNDPRGDALHLALASYHSCHFLLTWNCAHLANANKFEHIRHINTQLGLFVPTITTPTELMSWKGESDENR